MKITDDRLLLCPLREQSVAMFLGFLKLSMQFVHRGALLTDLVLESRLICCIPCEMRFLGKSLLKLGTNTLQFSCKIGLLALRCVVSLAEVQDECVPFLQIPVMHLSSKFLSSKEFLMRRLVGSQLLVQQSVILAQCLHLLALRSLQVSEGLSLNALALHQASTCCVGVPTQDLEDVVLEQQLLKPSNSPRTS